MTESIFVLRAGGSVTKVCQADYDSEALLQELLAKHPDLLAGEQIDSASPRRWILVSREMAIPDQDASAGRWSLDHLFLDQDGIPTLVEVKRSTDTRIRREVIGQVLDYAANAILYWTAEEIQARVDYRCKIDSEDPDEALLVLLEQDHSPDEFWQLVKTNLQAGRIRIVFVADTIPPELRRVVEFLNTQMDPAEVIAIEVKQYVGDDLQTLVPRVVSRTETTRKRKPSGSSSGKTWDRESFLLDLQQRKDLQHSSIAEKCLAWSESHGLRVGWGHGKYDGSFYPWFDGEHGSIPLFSVWTYGRIEIPFQYMSTPPYDEGPMREQLARQLSEIPEVTIPVDAINRRPSFPLDKLLPADSLALFLRVFDEMIDQINRHQALPQ